MRPILANSCALATTAEEARYRIDAPIAGRRGARILALDDEAATIVRQAAQQPWNGARFFVSAMPPTAGDDSQPAGVNGQPDLALHRLDGSTVWLSEELIEADVAVMVATTEGDGEAAEVIGRACVRRGIMTAGLVLGDPEKVEAAVFTLRPHAQVLLVTRDEADLVEILTALRA
jgi:hypothetical protein